MCDHTMLAAPALGRNFIRLGFCPGLAGAAKCADAFLEGRCMGTGRRDPNHDVNYLFAAA